MAGDGTAARAKLDVSIRPARVADLGALLRLYRHRSESSKGTYHPFPFDRPRLALIFLWMTLSRRRMRFLIRHLPRLAATMLVARIPGDPSPIAYGTIRIDGARGEEPVARFGFLVADAYQGKHVGNQLIGSMLLAAKALGLRKAGGTILAHNTPSRRIAGRWGLILRPAAADPKAPNTQNLSGVEDIDVLLAAKGKRSP